MTPHEIPQGGENSQIQAIDTLIKHKRTKRLMNKAMYLLLGKHPKHEQFSGRDAHVYGESLIDLLEIQHAIETGYKSMSFYFYNNRRNASERILYLNENLYTDHNEEMIRKGLAIRVFATRDSLYRGITIRRTHLYPGRIGSAASTKPDRRFGFSLMIPHYEGNHFTYSHELPFGEYERFFLQSTIPRKNWEIPFEPDEYAEQISSARGIVKFIDGYVLG